MSTALKPAASSAAAAACAPTSDANRPSASQCRGGDCSSSLRASLPACGSGLPARAAVQAGGSLAGNESATACSTGSLVPALPGLSFACIVASRRRREAAPTLEKRAGGADVCAKAVFFQPLPRGSCPLGPSIPAVNEFTA